MYDIIKKNNDKESSFSQICKKRDKALAVSLSTNRKTKFALELCA